MADKPYDIINKPEPRGQSVTYKGIPCTARTCVTELNRFTRDNEVLMQRNNELDQKLRKTQHENIRIKNIIRESMENERTHIGHNVLKQLYEAIQ